MMFLLLYVYVLRTSRAIIIVFSRINSIVYFIYSLASFFFFFWIYHFFKSLIIIYFRLHAWNCIFLLLIICRCSYCKKDNNYFSACLYTNAVEVLYWCIHCVAKATGGGAYKYADLFKERLGVSLDKEDEMDCLVAGANFLLKVEPCFKFFVSLAFYLGQLYRGDRLCLLNWYSYSY